MILVVVTKIALKKNMEQEYGISVLMAKMTLDMALRRNIINTRP
jgi:hypothetical protein